MEMLNGQYQANAACACWGGSDHPAGLADAPSRKIPAGIPGDPKQGRRFSLALLHSGSGAEVTLQPVRRFDFDAAILFADILLLPHALGKSVWFVDGEGPRLESIGGASDIESLRPAHDVHERLSPVYETLRLVSGELASDKALIGFAGAPWTVATYMIAGRGTPGQEPALKFLSEQDDAFGKLIDILTESTSEYLIAQVSAGAEIVQIFDSWAGSLQGERFDRFAVEPARKIVAALKGGFPMCRLLPFHDRRALATQALQEPPEPTAWLWTSWPLRNGAPSTFRWTGASRGTSTPFTSRPAVARLWNGRAGNRGVFRRPSHIQPWSRRTPQRDHRKHRYAGGSCAKPLKNSIPEPIAKTGDSLVVKATWPEAASSSVRPTDRDRFQGRTWCLGRTRD